MLEARVDHHRRRNGRSHHRRLRFYRCTSLETVTLPSRTVSIGDYAFSFGSTSEASLTSITLNEGLESIGDYAFYRAGTLSAVNIPSTVSYLGRYAFGFAGIGESTLNIPEDADFKVTFAATPEGQTPVDLTMGDYAFYMTAPAPCSFPSASSTSRNMPSMAPRISRRSPFPPPSATWGTCAPSHAGVLRLREFGIRHLHARRHAAAFHRGGSLLGVPQAHLPDAACPRFRHEEHVRRV